MVVSFHKVFSFPSVTSGREWLLRADTGVVALRLDGWLESAGMLEVLVLLQSRCPTAADIASDCDSMVFHRVFQW